MKLPPLPPQPHLSSSLAPTSLDSSNEERMRDAAKALEASFLSIMLNSAGLGKSPSTFGGGEGESQFSSFLVTEQARALSEAGGIGLAEHIFNELKGRSI